MPLTSQRLIAKVAVSAAVFSIDKPYDYSVPEHFQGFAEEGRRVVVPFGSGNKKADGFIIKLVPDTGERRLKPLHHIFLDSITLTREDIAIALWMRNRYFCTFFQAANALLPPGMWSRQGEVFLPGELEPEDARELLKKSPKRLAVLEAVLTGDRPLSEAEIEQISGVPSASMHIKALVKLGALRVSQSFDKKVGEKLIWQVRLAMPLEQAKMQIGTGEPAKKRLAVIECVAQADSLPENELIYLTGAGQSIIKRLAQIGVLERDRANVFRRPRIEKLEKSTESILNGEQQSVFDSLCALQDGSPHAALLHGVTGSGKTQIYIKLIERALREQKSAILLVPEIALTPQMLRIFYSQFGDEVAVVHSALTYAQRYDEYRRIQSGKARVVIGTRTAVFAPLENIGVIIIDEEHEQSYKSDADPRYHARDIAKYRSVLHKCLLVLGSATPSIESMHSAKSGRYSLFEIENRFGDTPLPSAVIDDMRASLIDGSDCGLGPKLLEMLRENFERGEQSILFINRRGSARMCMCIGCGYIPMCVNCSVALTFHSRNKRLMCHHCGHSQPLPDECPECGDKHLRLVGSGTQKIEEELAEILPGAKILRMDADTTVGRTTHEQLLDEFGSGKADILLGTQMVAKGLDFDNVTLVGVLDADLSLYFGDWRATERTFSLISQVVGRAGRRLKQGRAVIQTFSPKNPVILAAARQDYKDFYRVEIESRQAQRVPPFCDIIVFTLSGIDENTTLAAALGLSAALVKGFTGKYEPLKTPVFGPVAAVIAKLNRRYRFSVSFRGEDNRLTREFISKAIASYYSSPFSRAVAVSAEINP